MTPAIVSVHYHLRPGGVSEVIRQTDRILTDAGVPHLLLAEESGLPELGYDATRSGTLTDPLLRAAREALGERPRLWHFHNPCLGKNPALTRSLQSLADAGEPMILQHHDLAEDHRPDNLAVLEAVAAPYPDSPRIIHAFLNERDRDAFIRAGLPAERAVILPNPAPFPSPVPPPPGGPAVVLLPMRGIPRKNLGEMLLLAAAAPEGTRFLQGSAPAREEWRPAYEAWRRFADEQQLPVTFDIFCCEAPDACTARATHLLTTSTQEGFGLIHLEGANRRRVLGRRIPYLGLDGFPDDGLYDALVSEGADFAQLDAPAQREQIRAVQEGTHEVDVIDRTKSTPVKEWLHNQLSDRDARDASAGMARHSDAAHLKRLTELRARLLDARPGPVRQLDRGAIAAAFK